VSIVVVSNRVARAKADEPMTGGLAAALLPAVKGSGAIWVGASDRTRETPGKDTFAEIEALGTGALATVEMPSAHYRGYYEGFANSVLWPALHSRPDLIRTGAQDYRSYREVNAFMARALLRFARPDTLFWVQDYHFLTLALELRAMGIRRPIGFFLHTPLPECSALMAVPHHRDLVNAMLAYDLIGFQTEQDCDNFVAYVTRVLGLGCHDGRIKSSHGITRVGVFPISIDAEMFANRATKSAARPEVTRLRSSLHGAKLVIGVDRVDYSKGIANRLHGFARMLQAQPALRRAVALLQIAVPSREQIEAYGQLNAELAALVTDVNARLGEVDWTPIRYLNRSFSQPTLAGFYRTAQVGLVTPLHDGMNLVAKEYVAAQNPFDPGVLVLSEFAGAARELDGALLVNPHDIDGLASAIASALSMPGDERRERWESMMQHLRGTSVQSWFADFAGTLAETRPPYTMATEATTVPARAVGAERAVLTPLRSP
jgi:trehalose 6-phosphate synthase